MTDCLTTYGKALFSLAIEENSVESMQEEARILRNIIKDNVRFLVVLGSEFVSIKEKNDIVDTTFSSFSKHLKSFIKIIVENGHAKELLNILESFNSFCNQYKGVGEGIVFSIEPLDDKTKSLIEEKISKKENKKVELINRIDPSLIGGIKVVINNHIYDGSVKNQIETMKSNLLLKEEN